MVNTAINVIKTPSDRIQTWLRREAAYSALRCRRIVAYSADL